MVSIKKVTQNRNVFLNENLRSDLQNKKSGSYLNELDNNSFHYRFMIR